MPVKFSFGTNPINQRDEWIMGLKPGETRVRFLDEYSMLHDRGWAAYWEHWMPSIRMYVPCSPPECVGCASDDPNEQKKGKKFLVNVLNEEGKVKLIKLAYASFKVQADTFFKDYNTLTDRDYLIRRFGEGKGTVYQLTPTQNTFRLEKTYQKFDPAEIAQQTHDRAAQKLYGPPAVTIGVPLEMLEEPIDEEETLVPDPLSDGADAQHWNKSNLDLSNASKEDLVRYLTEQGVEVPDKAYRSALVSKVRALQK